MHLTVNYQNHPDLSSDCESQTQTSARAPPPQTSPPTSGDLELRAMFAKSKKTRRGAKLGCNALELRARETLTITDVQARYRQRRRRR